VDTNYLVLAEEQDIGNAMPVKMTREELRERKRILREEN
jgi:hypothetical protein